MKKHNNMLVIMVCVMLCMIATLTGCGKQTLGELLAEDSSAIEKLRNSSETIECSDYTAYSIGGGIDDEINATRYGIGLVETSSRFVRYRYIVKDNETGWKYIFADLDDIPTWVKNGKKNSDGKVQVAPLELSETDVIDALRNGGKQDYLKTGRIQLESMKTTYRYPDEGLGREDIYTFKILVDREYCTDVYTATMTYSVSRGRNKELKWELKDHEIRQLDSEFTKFGLWKYEGQDTKIYITINNEDSGKYSGCYKIEFDVTYYKSTWTNSGIVNYKSNGPVTEFGYNKTDENREPYLMIKLEGFDDSGNKIDAGWLAIYPDKGVYWKAVNAAGDPFKLKQE